MGQIYTLIVPFLAPVISFRPVVLNTIHVISSLLCASRMEKDFAPEFKSQTVMIESSAPVATWSNMGKGGGGGHYSQILKFQKICQIILVFHNEQIKH